MNHPPRRPAAATRPSLLFLALIAALAPLAPAAAQNARPLADLRRASTLFLEPPRLPPSLGAAGDHVAYFVAYDPVHLTQVWRSDGTVQGSVPIGDFKDDLPNGLPFPIDLYGAAGDRAIFMRGRNLWSASPPTTDAGASFEILQAGVVPFIRSSPDTRLPAARLGSRLIFQARDFGVNGVGRLLGTDGTAAGTFTLASALNADFGVVAAAGDRVYFSRRSSNLELWSSQGTPQTTVLVRSLFPRSSGSISWITPAPGGAFFVAPGPQTGYGLWRTDGSGPGTSLLVNRPVSTAMRALAWTGSQLGFVVTVGTNFGLQSRLWVSDGSPAGTSQASWPGDIFIPDFPQSSYPELDTAQPLVALDGRLIWRGTIANRVSIYAGDGSAAGSFPVTPNNVDPSRLWTVDGPDGRLAYFVARSPDTTFQLWRTNGLPQGTFPLTAFNFVYSDANISLLFSLNGRLIFKVGGDALFDRFPIWITDGSVAGTTQFLDPTRRLLSNSDPQKFARDPAGFDTFQASGEQGFRFRTDGTPSGTLPFPCTGTWPPGLSQVNSAPLNGRIFRQVRSRAPGCGASSGYHAYLHLAQDSCTAGDRFYDFGDPASSGSAFGAIFPLNDRVIFAGPVRGDCTGLATTLWRSDGTAEGTAEIHPPGGWGQVDYPGLYVSTIFRGRAYFSIGPRLWSSDGTDEGTFILLDFASGNPFTAGADRAVAEDSDADARLFFQVGTQLWVCERPFTSARRVDPLFQAWGGQNFGAALGGRLVIPGRRVGSNAEVFITNADATELLPLVRTNPGPDSGVPSGLVSATTPAGPRVFFTASDGVHGNELWVTDGTPAGTHLLIDLWPGPPGSFPSNLTAAADGLFFVANAGLTGRELWRTDGTEQGARLVADITPGPLSTPIANITPVGDHLYFSASAPGTGAEPWVVSLRPCPADFDLDGFLTPDDLADFITAYFAPGPPDPRLDFNADNQVDPDDLADFVAAYFAGC